MPREAWRAFAIPFQSTGDPASVTFAPGVAPPRPVAHRAASQQAPENTRAAISKALTLGIEVIELDVRLSRDGVPVLLHDATLDRTTSAARPATALTAAELANLDAGSLHHPGFADESVPTLAEAFDLIDGAARVNIDVKTDAAAPPVIDVIRRSRVEDDVVISGCTTPRAGEVRRLAPEVHLLLNHRPSSPAADGEPPHSPAFRPGPTRSMTNPVTKRSSPVASTSLPATGPTKCSPSSAGAARATRSSRP